MFEVVSAVLPPGAGRGASRLELAGCGLLKALRQGGGAGGGGVAGCGARGKA